MFKDQHNNPFCRYLLLNPRVFSAMSDINPEMNRRNTSYFARDGSGSKSFDIFKAVSTSFSLGSASGPPSFGQGEGTGEYIPGRNPRGCKGAKPHRVWGKASKRVLELSQQILWGTNAHLASRGSKMGIGPPQKLLSSPYPVTGGLLHLDLLSDFRFPSENHSLNSQYPKIHDRWY